jgi:hypothetical protein
MLPDVIELDELVTGQRREGIYNSLFVVFQRVRRRSPFSSSSPSSPPLFLCQPVCDALHADWRRCHTGAFELPVGHRGLQASHGDRRIQAGMASYSSTILLMFVVLFGIYAFFHFAHYSDATAAVRSETLASATRGSDTGRADRHLLRARVLLSNHERKAPRDHQSARLEVDIISFFFLFFYFLTFLCNFV